MIRTAKAIWRGTGRDGSGELSTESGALTAAPYTFVRASRGTRERTRKN